MIIDTQQAVLQRCSRQPKEILMRSGALPLRACAKDVARSNRRTCPLSYDSRPSRTSLRSGVDWERVKKQGVPPDGPRPEVFSDERDERWFRGWLRRDQLP